MDGFEFNKIAGAVLGTGLGIMALGIIAESIYTPAVPAKPGFEIAVADTGGTGGDGQQATVAPIEVRLQTASADAGAKVATKCKGCHSFDPNGQRGPAGPNLYNVVGAPAAHMEGFPYSPAMQARRASGALWTFGDLDKFLTSPKAFVPGTAMGFAGLPKPEDRANVIAYLRSLSPNPVPLPPPPATAAAGTTPTANGEPGPVPATATPPGSTPPNPSPPSAEPPTKPQ